MTAQIDGLQRDRALRGRRSSAKTLIIASHYDTVLNAGNYDAGSAS